MITSQLSRQHAKLIVCSDCLYSSGAVEPLIIALEQIAHDDTIILIANELRSALEEFLYLLRRRVEYTVTIQEIEVSEAELTIVRSAQQLFIAPPIRVLSLRIQRRVDSNIG
jgi:hypothetical protein